MNIDTTVFHRSLHLDESKLEQPDTRCPFCNSSNRDPVYSLQETPEILLMQCQSCAGVSASRMPTTDTLTEYYSGYYDDSQHLEGAGDELVTFDEPQRFARHLADMYWPFNVDKLVTILDFGGGNGAISHLLAIQLIGKGAQQVDITVVDYNKETVCPKDSRITIKKAESLRELGGDFGFVIASAVIEHHSHPRTLLQQLLQLVEQGGVFYARTPYMLPIMQLLRFFGVKLDFTYPGHIHDLGQAFWEGYFIKKQPDDFQVLASKPSIVETTLDKHFIRTVAAYSLKAPWYILRGSYKLVGGWEIFAQKNLE